MSKNIVIAILIILLIITTLGFVYFGVIKGIGPNKNERQIIEDKTFEIANEESEKISDSVAERIEDKKNALSESFGENLANAVENKKIKKNDSKIDYNKSGIYKLYKTIFKGITISSVFYLPLYLVLIIIGLLFLIKGQAVKRYQKIGWTFIVTCSLILILLNSIYLVMLVSFTKQGGI